MIAFTLPNRRWFGRAIRRPSRRRMTLSSALRKTQKVVRQEPVIFSLQVISTLVRPDDHPDRLSLFADVIVVRVPLYVSNRGGFGVVEPGSSDVLNTPVTIRMVWMLGNAGDFKRHLWLLGLEPGL